MQNTTRAIYQPITLLGILLLVTACGEKQEEQVEQPLRPVRTIVASATDAITGRDFPGIVIAENKADLSFRVPGKLIELLIKEGSKVKKGQILARLDQTDFKIELEARQANYSKAKANFSRSAKILEAGAGSQRDLDQTKATYSTAAAELKAAKQNLIYTEVKSPFDGNITNIYVANYEEVQAKEKIATLQDLKSLEIEIDVPESLMIRVKKRGQEQRKVYASFDAIQGKRFSLAFLGVSAQADEATQAYKVRFALPVIEDYIILPGMTATVVADSVTTAENQSKNEIIIPSHAVLEDSNGRFVYIAEPETSSPTTGLVHRRNVTISRLTNSGLIITSGINPADLVITAGMSKMQEGLRVRLMVDPGLIGQQP
jgi:RND family efflux transporter MFP subunit